MSLDMQFLREKIVDVEARRHKLVIICGDIPPYYVASLRHQLGLPTLNLNLHLSKDLLETPIARRPLVASSRVQYLVNSYQEGFILLYNIELLFHPGLKLDPLALLENTSRSKGLVVTWNGQYSQGILSYAIPGHPEYRAYTEMDAQVLSV